MFLLLITLFAPLIMLEPLSIASDDYHLLFSKIDNRVEVFVGDSLVFNSETIENAPNLKYEVRLSQTLTEAHPMIKVLLFNGRRPYTSQLDPLWEVRFELFKNNEAMDFFYESGADNQIGKVLEIPINLNDY